MSVNGFQDILFDPQTSFHEVLARIDRRSLGFGLVVDPEGRLLGAITDGDVRRALMGRHDLNLTAAQIMNASPRVMPAHLKTADQRSGFLATERITFAPVLDVAGRVVEIVLSDHLPGRTFDEIAVVIMAGGLGSRLGELTRDLPKPLLHVGGEPILQRIVKQFKSHGFHRFVFCVNHKAELIRDHFGDGRTLGVEIAYVQEEKRLGTGGALSLVDPAMAERFFVSNADIVTDNHYRDMLDFHLDQRSLATMAVREHEVQIPFGVVETEGFEIRSLREKPTYTHFINAGFYMLEREALGFVPRDQFFDMPSLFELLRATRKRTRIYPTAGQWIDIGRPEDLHRAQRESQGKGMQE